MEAEAVRAVIDRYMDAWKKPEPGALADFHAIDGVVESPMYATRCGRPSIEDAYRAFLTSFPDARQTVEALVVEPPSAALFTIIAATHINEFFGLPGSGRHIEFRLCQLIQMRDGLMLHVRRVYDFTGLLVQVGVLRTKVVKPDLVVGERSV